MNTVEALKNLYKTMSGKDWPYDPNPTDAEVIDKIAADGNAGGSPMVVSVDIDANPTNPDQYTATLTTPWEEIANAFNSGQTVLVQVGVNTTAVTSVSFTKYDDDVDVYSVEVSVWPYYTASVTGVVGAVFSTSAPDGEPVYTVT